MGVPKFYRWLSERYPLINQQVTSTSRAECDNLYLDMNGIIHNSAHSDDSSDELRLRLTEQQIFTNVFKYLDKLFRLVRPRKLLYMALDGVAPRAKMNQQRQRRFRSAAEAANQLQLARQRGDVMGDLQPFDSNQITPGTEFMKRLSDALKYFIRRKMREDSAWQRIKVVLSGSEVPGEGEHKIMLFIRNMKMQQNYNPNIRHCLYGLDADLIFLSLVSHEPHFFLLREEVLFGKGGGGGRGGDKLPRKVLKNLDEFQLLHISLLRDYLYLEYLPLAQHFHWPGGFDQERLIDDWVFLAYLCGNDFLPHLPTLDIGEGGLDTLFRLYKESLSELDGWITEYGTLHVRRLEVILRKMGRLEEDVFQKRLEDVRDQERRERRGRRRAQEIAAEVDFADDDMKVLRPPDVSPLTSASPEPVTVLAGVTQEDTGATIKQRYYHDKFPQFYDAGLAGSHPELFDTSPVPSSPDEHRRSLVANYLEGLMWIQKYYYQGVPSWKWYFRYRYAPLASDMVDLASITVSFNLGQPFRPLEQLLGVLPPASRNFLPPVYRDMMIGDSAIADFYPLQFAVDMNGKRNSWEGIALIPFIEERRLLDAVSRLDQTRLSTMEKLRNVRVGDEYIYEYDATNKDTYPPPLPGFTPIKECQSKVSVWSLPLIPLSSRSLEQAASFAAVAAVSRLTTTPRSTSSPSSSDVTSSSTSSSLVDLHVKPLAEYEAQEQIPQPQEGNFIPTVPRGCRRPYPGFPSLLALKTISQLRAIGVDVFGSPSRKDTLVLAVQQGEQPSDTQLHYVAQLIGKRVWVDWPYLREAEVVSVTDGRSRVTADSTVVLMPALLDSHIRECRSHQQKQLSTRGVDAYDVSVLVSVRAFTGLRRMDDGSIRKTFESDVTVPAQLISAHNPAPDERWVEQPAPTLQSSFPLGMTVIYVGPNYYGALATITGHTSTVPGRQQVALSLLPPPPSPPFGQQIARTSRLQFYPSHLVAQSLELHPLVLSKVCSSIYVFPGYGDLGLKLRYSKQSMQVPEYARRVDSWQEPRQKRPLQHVNDRQGGNSYDSVADSGGSWEYSEKAVALVAAYKKRFPHLFDMLQASPHEYKYPAASLSSTGSAKEGDAILKEITDWLTTVGTNNLILVPCTSQMMADRGVKAVEAESARLRQMHSAQTKQPVPLDHVSLLHLYPPNPALAWSPTESEGVELGDRVLSVRSDASVPLGLRGTVVGVHSKSSEIVWDEEFMTGNSLNGRCHHLRGQTLPFTAFINLSKPNIVQLGRKQDNSAAKQQARVALSALGGKKAAAAAHPAKPAAAKLVAAAGPHEPRIASKLDREPPFAVAPTAAAHSGLTAAPATAALNKPKPAAAAPTQAATAPIAPPAQPRQLQPVAAAEEKAVSTDAGDELVAMWNKLQEEVKTQQSTAATPSTTAAAARPIASVVQPATGPVSGSDDVDSASALLKQLLHVGSVSSTGPVPVAAAAANSGAETESDDPLASKIAKSKARKAAAAALPSPAAVAAAYTSTMPASSVQPQYLHQSFNTFSQPTTGPVFPPAQPPVYAPHGYTAPAHFPTQPHIPAAVYPQPQPPHFYPPFGTASAAPHTQQGGRGRGNAATAHRGGAAPHSGRGGQWQPKPTPTEGGGT